VVRPLDKRELSASDKKCQQNNPDSFVKICKLHINHMLEADFLAEEEGGLQICPVIPLNFLAD
jgi:hypothetical protein